jgi:hypothetical protein
MRLRQSSSFDTGKSQTRDSDSLNARVSIALWPCPRSSPKPSADPTSSLLQTRPSRRRMAASSSITSGRSRPSSPPLFHLACPCTSIGFSDTEGLQAALERPRYRNALILVAWEHRIIENTVRALLTAHDGDVTEVPKKWHGDDFDSMYVVTITRTGHNTKATFALKHEGLDGQKHTCPQSFARSIGGRRDRRTMGSRNLRF